MTVTNGYISLPIETNPTTIQQDALATIAAELPGWVPREGHIEVLLLEQFAAMVAESANVAAQVPLAIFSYFGFLVGITPEAGASATASTTWTMTNNLGYTIPAGTVVGYQILGNQTYQFTTVNNVVVPAGQISTPSGAVEIISSNTGTAYNGLPAQNLTLITALSYVATVQAVDISSGGVDPETTTAYINRLSAELQLLTPRPILPADFAALTVNVTGAYRAVAIGGLSPGRGIGSVALFNTSSVISSPTASFNSGFDIGRTVTGVGIPSGTIILSVSSASSATMSSEANATVVNGTVVLGNLTNQERTVTVAAVDVNGNPVSSVVQSQISTYLQAQREVNFIVNVVAPTYTTINVQYSVYASPGYSTTALNSQINAAIESYLSPAVWGGGTLTPPSWDAALTTVRYLGIAGAIEAVVGVQYIASLQIGVQGFPLSTVDIPMAGATPLPQPGQIAGSVLVGT